VACAGSTSRGRIEGTRRGVWARARVDYDEILDGGDVLRQQTRRRVRDDGQALRSSLLSRHATRAAWMMH
jgi:hypothetical protein